MTTSSRVPSTAPASAASSMVVKLSTVGSHLRRQTSFPSPSSTRTVCAGSGLPESWSGVV